MNVMEVYRSVQGEGTLLGVPTTFVRFFACNLRCSWCFVPDTPILIADWSWRRLGDLKLGDVVLGIERPETPGRHNRLVPSTVERVSTRLAPTVSVNGEVRCTADHKFWLTGRDREGQTAVYSGWREVERALGMRAMFVAAPAIDQSSTNMRMVGEYANVHYGTDIAVVAASAHSRMAMDSSLVAVPSLQEARLGQRPQGSRVIERVEPTGLVEPVVTLTTSAGSFVAGGYVVKNCDTKYSWSVREGGTWESMAPEVLADKVGELGARHVVLTGGEPTLQRDLADLAGILKARGHHLTVETNATIFPEAVVPLIDLWSLSPKLPSAGEGYLRPPVLERFLAALRPDQQQWKFVVRDDQDERALREFLQSYPVFVERQLPIVLQPEGDVATQDYPAALEQLAERVRDPFWDRYYVRTLPQMHVIIWGRRRWV